MPSSPLAQPEEDRKPLPRACDIAEDYFKKELAMHEGIASAVNAGTLVIIHDHCYGHRYARPKTSKSTLSTIMERPERILASVRGIAMAYVRLGERHCHGSNPPRPNQSPSERIPFKIRKTSRTVDLTSQVVINVHGTEWMTELKRLCNNAGQKLASTGKELVRDLPTTLGQPPKPAFHPYDLYLCSSSLDALQGALGGVLDAVDAVFQGSGLHNGVSRAFVCIRPPGHHCSEEWPSGFCWLNNVHVGIEHAMMNHGLTHAAIIDFDLHHGDGSQDITWAQNDKVRAMHKNTPNWKKTSIGYFSLHDINSFPCEEGDRAKVQAASLCIDNAHGQSIWNIHLETWSTKEEFWQIYEKKYLILLDKARKYLKFHTSRFRESPNHPTPKAAIFLSAGFDASEWETAGMQRHTVNVPTEFYARFTRDVVRLAEELDTGVEGRIISVLEGGYSDRALSSGVLSHLSGLCDGQVWSEVPAMTGGLSDDLNQRMNGLSMYDQHPPPPASKPSLNPLAYDPSWWHESQLVKLEQLVTPTPLTVPKKVRSAPPAHFSSPTQSFTAKVVDPSKINRSFSGKYSSSPSRAPTPPPPEVDWVVAAHALSRLLVPSDRQTTSYRHDELAEPRTKKEKPMPTLASVHVDPSGRQLRGRKPVTSYADVNSDDESTSVRAESRASRRQTIADFPLVTDEPSEPKLTTSRRMSIASSIGSVSGTSHPERTASRASSVLPTRRSGTPGAGAARVQVKKARATNATARPPVPRVPSNYLTTTTASKEKEKENNEMDQLTSRVQRVKLNLPSKEEYEAREKLKETEKKTKTIRKTPASGPAKPTSKKGPGRPPKATKPPSSVQSATGVPTPAPDPPKLTVPVITPLEQPRPSNPQPAVVGQAGLAKTPKQVPFGPSPKEVSSQSHSIFEPPTELVEMTITPEQLPKPPFMQVEETFPLNTSPPRPDTPPPPPPSTIPQLISDAAGYNIAEPISAAQVSSILSIGPPKPDATLPLPTGSTMPMRPPSGRQSLPVFSANGIIPFATKPNNALTAPEQAETEAGNIREAPDTPTH